MMVFPARSTTLASAGMATPARGPIAVIRSPLMTMTPSSITPPSRVAMVRIRAPVSASVAVGLSAATSIDSDRPEVGGLNLASAAEAPSAWGPEA